MPPHKPNDEEARFMRAALPAMQDTTPLQVEITVADAWFLVSALQLATRHPGLGEPMKARLSDIGHQFQGAIVEHHPEVQFLIERGWHEMFDV